METKTEREVKGWIGEILGQDLGSGDLHDMLKDGVVLCNLINKITGKPSKFPNNSKASFIQMENICYFINQAKQMGVPDSENFLTVDLFEGKNMCQVVCCIYSLSRNLHKNGRTDLPLIGPRLTEEVKITFNKAQLDEAKRTVSLQYGYAPEIDDHSNMNR
ncbi:transgelin [Pancytospora epiphaga]|nr:transgelin [Pancytospora epiphaga]